MPPLQYRLLGKYWKQYHHWYRYHTIMYQYWYHRQPTPTASIYDATTILALLLEIVSPFILDIVSSLVSTTSPESETNYDMSLLAPPELDTFSEILPMWCLFALEFQIVIL